LAEVVGVAKTARWEEAPKAAAAAVSAVTSSQPDTNVLPTAADLIGELDGPSAIDQFMDNIRHDRRLDRDRVAELARWLCCNGTRSSVVKAGLALLGATGTDSDSFLIQRLGFLRHSPAQVGHSSPPRSAIA
jgi:hypothetical protein